MATLSRSTAQQVRYLLVSAALSSRMGDSLRACLYRAEAYSLGQQGNARDALVRGHECLIVGLDGEAAEWLAYADYLAMPRGSGLLEETANTLSQLVRFAGVLTLPIIAGVLLLECGRYAGAV